MRRPWMLVTGVAMIVAGLAGVAVVGYLFAASAGTVGVRTETSRGAERDRWFGLPGNVAADQVGESIYRFGVGSDGAVPARGGPAWFRRMGGGCIVCHGVDGRGGSIAPMMGRALEPPDIRYSTLTRPHAEEEGTSTAGWTDAQIARVVREGVEPDGEVISDDMPSFDLDDADMLALIDYLKELDRR